MKLAEALMERADLQKRAAGMKERLRRAVRVQEGETPPEQPQELLDEMQRILSRLELLINAINRANVSLPVAEGLTMAEALTARTLLAQKSALLREVLAHAAEPSNRYSRSEIREVTTIAPAELQSEIDRTGKEHRRLDIMIQQANWSCDLDLEPETL